MKIKRRYIFMISLLLVGISTSTKAIPLNKLPPIRVYLLIILGEKGYSETDSVTIGMEAIAYLNKNLNLKLVVSEYESRLEAQRIQSDDVSRQAQLQSFVDEFEIRSTPFSDLILVLTPPVWSGNDYYLGGLSVSPCRWEGSSSGYHGRRVSVVNIEPTNPDGLSRVKESVTAIQHELLHLLGAEHYYSRDPAIMDPAAIRFAGQFPLGEVPIGAITKDEVRLCFDSPRARSKFHLPNVNYSIETGL